MEPKELFKKMLVEDISPLFKERGYKKKDTVFYTEKLDIVQIVNLIPSRWNTAHNISFSIDYAIFFKPYFDLFGRPKPRSWNCYQSYRPLIGGNIYLLRNPSEYVPDYEIFLGTDIKALSQDVKRNLEKYIFPYMDKLTTIKGLIEEIERQAKEGNSTVAEYDTILLYSLIGQKQKAQEKLIHAWKLDIDNPKYKPMLLNIAGKLGLEINGLK